MHAYNGVLTVFVFLCFVFLYIG